MLISAVFFMIVINIAYIFYILKNLGNKLRFPLLIFQIDYALNSLLGTMFPIFVFIFTQNDSLSADFKKYIFFLVSLQVIYIFLNLFFIRIFKLHKKYEKNKTELVLNNKKALKYCAFFCYSFFLIWVFYTQGLSIIDPRRAYIELRVGAGYLWVFGMLSSSLFLCVKIASKNLKIFETIFHFFIIYTYGSKGLLLASTTALLLSRDFKQSFVKSRIYSLIKKYRKIIYIIILISFIVIFLRLYGYSFSIIGSKEILKFTSYFSSINNANRAINSREELSEIIGKIHITSLWNYIPRSIFPNKPFAYGNVLINEHFFPGLSELGHTAPFGPYIRDYLIGIWGYFPAVFNFTNIGLFFALRVLSKRQSLNEPIALFFYSYLILPYGVTFNMPWFFGIFLAIFLLRLRWNLYK